MSGARLTLAVAGHVDHGKTALTRALTGVETDRLPEERRRGLSILPGFADLALPSGRPASVVDLPGHERFVRHMIGGAAGVDGALLCVASHDGFMPQTREHLDVLDLLGIPVVAVALTFADRARHAVLGDRIDRLSGVPVVPVAAPEGVGVEDLRAVLDEALAPRIVASRGEARLAVDRVFTIRGAGTVVTGALCGEGGLEVGDPVRVEPSGAEGRVRRVEVHDGPMERAVRGRVALNLAGVSVEHAARGSVVLAAGSGTRPTDRLVARVRQCSRAPRPLRGRERLRAFLGTAEATARIRLLETSLVAPGEEADVELRLERPVLVVPDDRLVLRTPDAATVAGGPVLAARPRRGNAPSAGPARHARPTASVSPEVLIAVEGALERAGLHGVDPDRIDGVPDDPAARRAALSALRARGLAVHSGRRWFHEAAVRRAEARAVDSWTEEERTLGELRRTWGVSRASAEALATLLDGRGVTRRLGSLRRLRRGATAR